MEFNVLVVVWSALVLAVMLISVTLYNKHQKKEKAKPVEGKKTSELVYTEEKKLVAVVDARSEDEKYAESHNKWICRYCETMNTFPPGAAVKKKEPAPPAPISSKSVSGLRGDLLKKMNADSEGGTPAVLVCTACGKQQ